MVLSSFSKYYLWFLKKHSGRRKWQPTPVFLPGESQGWGAWWATVYGVAKSRSSKKHSVPTICSMLCISIVSNCFPLLWPLRLHFCMKTLRGCHKNYLDKVSCPSLTCHISDLKKKIQQSYTTDLCSQLKKKRKRFQLM